MGRPPNEPDPSAGPLELFAYEHRRYRKAAGISQSDLAAEIVFTPQFVGMVEVAARTPGRQYVEGADRVLGANGGLIACWRLVSRMHIPKWFGPFIDVEARAKSMRAWEIAAVPGLFQTADYARELAYADRPDATAEQIDREVDVRMQRQEILRRADPPRVWTVIDEMILRRRAGSPQIMRDQLERLLEVADLPHVVVQILPVEAGVNPGQVGAFEILKLEDQTEIVWVEGPASGRFLDLDEQVEECVRRYDYLRAMAFSPAASRKLITALLEETCEPPTPTSSPGASPATAPVRAGTASK